MWDSTLNVGNKLLLHKLKRWIVSRAILTSEIPIHKFTKISSHGESEISTRIEMLYIQKEHPPLEYMETQWKKRQLHVPCSEFHTGGRPL